MELRKFRHVTVCLQGQERAGTRAYYKFSKLVRFYIPGRKFSRTGIIQYENGTTRVYMFKFEYLLVRFCVYF
jgi:hypothetical protein